MTCSTCQALGAELTVLRGQLADLTIIAAAAHGRALRRVEDDRQARVAGQRAAAPRAPKPAARVHEAEEVVAYSIVSGRDAAVLSALLPFADGLEPWAIRKAMPATPGLSVDQERNAYRATMLRLARAGLVIRDGARWRLTPNGQDGALQV